MTFGKAALALAFAAAVAAGCACLAWTSPSPREGAATATRAYVGAVDASAGGMYALGSWPPLEGDGFELAIAILPSSRGVLSYELRATARDAGSCLGIMDAAMPGAASVTVPGGLPATLSRTCGGGSFPVSLAFERHAQARGGAVAVSGEVP